MEELNKTQEVAKQPSATEQIVTDNAQQKSKKCYSKLLLLISHGF